MAIHGQHDSILLTDPGIHYRFVDRMASNGTEREEYKLCYDKLCALIKESRAVSTDFAERQRRIDMLEFQIKELEQADITPGELEELEGRRKVMQNSENIARSVSAALSALSGDENFSVRRDLPKTPPKVLPNARSFPRTYRKMRRGFRK